MSVWTTLMAHPSCFPQKKAGITPEQLIDRVNAEHQADFAGFHVAFSDYYSTHSPENKELVYQIYAALKADDKIVSRTIEQLFDPERTCSYRTAS